jgi:hypothetical protein
MFKFSVKIFWQIPWLIHGACELMDSSAAVFVDEFSILSTFSVILLVLGHPERLSSSTDTLLALRHECLSKTAVRLKESSLKASQSI